MHASTAAIILYVVATATTLWGHVLTRRIRALLKDARESRNRMWKEEKTEPMTINMHIQAAFAEGDVHKLEAELRSALYIRRIGWSFLAGTTVFAMIYGLST